MRRRRPQPARSVTGGATVEFALTFMVLWMLLGGAFRYGYAMYVYESLINAVADAARYAARADFDNPGHGFVAGVKNMAVYGSPVTGTAPLAPGLTIDNISVTWTTDDKGMPLTLTVSIVGYTINALFQTFTWNSKPSITVRFAGTYTT